MSRPVSWAGGTLRVGVDVVPVEEVARSVAQFGDRYVGRIYTDHEVACCRSSAAGGELVAESLAARFAAKEAVVKVLRPTGARPPWRSIEVHRLPEGACEIRLSGRAAELAEQAGISELAVSLTHERPLAAAVVVGGCTPGDGDGT